MNRHISSVAVLGSGVMGSRIACHFAHIGCRVLLLDIAPRELSDAEKTKGITPDHPMHRSRIARESLEATLKSNPSPIYLKKFAENITVGNLDDDLSKISDCDWVIEVVVENLEIKKGLFEKVEQHRKPGTLITSNTSGIPIALMTVGRSKDFVAHFCGTHFFNPPRYLPLLEIIPGANTNPEVLEFLMQYGQRYLGKETVMCKDTPAFIANRIGVYSMAALLHLVEEMDLTVSEVDKLTGPVLGRPKSATFRTSDVVGLDTLAKVAIGLDKNLTNDEQKQVFALPHYIQKMLDKNMLGSKTGQGFFKKVKTEDSSKILALNLKTLEYEEQPKAKFATLESTKAIDDLAARIPVFLRGKDKAGEFYRKSLFGLFAYVSHRIPEIADELYKIDDALRAGFGWKLGPFETWDAAGLKDTLKTMQTENYQTAGWVAEMVSVGNSSFYKTESGKKLYYDPATKSYKPIPGSEALPSLEILRPSKTVWKNSGATLVDLGDGILNLEFHTKMNTIGGEVLTGINKAIDIAEAEYRGLVISNTGDNFSAGANVGMIFMMAAEQEYDELDFAIRAFQNTVARIRFSSIPVVVAPHSLTLGGGTEISLHADKVIAHAETYMGLVEFGVGVIPGGGGTKEFALRASDEFRDGDVRINVLRNRFLTIGQAKVSTSAHEAFELGYLRHGIDEVVMSRREQLGRAKRAALTLWENGYTRPRPRTDITVLGKEGLGIVYVGANAMLAGGYISEHDQLISQKLGWVLCGGDLSQPTKVSEQYLLDMERRAFLELCMQRKTLERLQSIIKTGKVLRN
jgi:3-hydroxyacyl-CoA dehydrogenase